ncbi:DNA mismatch repair protein msh6 [Serendipita sp. 401]|nr:DNA mismatch repair protein msh6 [Serendipita sp. 401]KAG9056320.1 DNA mismatch repair protein msh6 [Serendipita sp. 407]
MSKQQPKQRTLEFFMQKPKQGQQSQANSTKKVPEKGQTAGSKPTNATASSSKSFEKDSDAAKRAIDDGDGIEISMPKVSTSSAATRGPKELVSSPLNPFEFSSSASVASDLRSRASSDSRETPPRSEIMDLDDEADEEVLPPKRLKRKLSITIDSDEEEDKPISKRNSVGTKSLGHSSSHSSIDISKTNNKNKGKSALARPNKRRKTIDYDDDFVVPDDEEEEEDEGIILDLNASDEEVIAKKTKTKGRALDLSSDEEGAEAPTKKGKPSKAPRPSISHVNSSSTSVGGLGMQTAAERRMQQQKQDKKEAEQPWEFLQEVRDKDKVRPNEDGYDPRTIYIPNDAWKSFTPFEKQFWEIKQNHYDTILFFQKGKFYELYEDDARVGHQLFDLKLTSRVKMSMVGVPEQSFDFWTSKFLAKGYKVGKVEQVETSIGAEMRVAAAQGKGKELVKRVLNKVFTNGTLTDGEYLNDDEAGHCISIREEGENKFGLAILDSSTSEFKLSSFEDDACRTRLETLLRQLRPKELILSKGNLSVSTNRLLKIVLPGTCTTTSLRSVEGYDYHTTLEELKKLYPSGDDDESLTNIPETIQSMIGDETTIIALGAMIWYLRTLNIDHALLSAKNFDIYDPMRKGQGLVIDGQTLAHIEVLMNSDGSEEGTLLKLIGKCVTPAGKRLFRLWLCMPLRDAQKINERLDAVEDLMRHETFEQDFLMLVKGMPDLERIVSRIHAGTCKEKDFLKVLDAFNKLNKGLSDLAEKASVFETPSVSGLLRSVEDLKPYLRSIKATFVQPASGDAAELVPQKGMDEEYDAVDSEISEIETDLNMKLQKHAKKLGIKLEFWHSSTGTKDIFLVQANTPDKKMIPKEWQKHNETKAKVRYTVPEFSASIRKLKEARENIKTAIKSFKTRLYAAFDVDRDVWLRTVRACAELDCLLSLAKSSVGIGSPACRPEFVPRDEGNGAFVQFEELRHPGIALALAGRGGGSGDFIANDVMMGGDKERIMLLTGPNMAGKSTLMRQTCVGVIMAQLGMYVPASRAKLSPIDAILTRMGAYDNMFSASSTFKVELDETCKILRTATPHSLVILDELGRGTSTFDGIAIAGAVLHHLATHTLALGCFATHYSSLTLDYEYHPNIRTMHMATKVDDEKRELIWLYKLVPGVAPSSFGTHVASLAGVPNTVVQRADTVSTDFSRQFAERLAGRTTGRVPVSAQVDLAYLAKLVQGQLSLDEEPVRRKDVLMLLTNIAGRYAKVTVEGK